MHSESKLGAVGAPLAILLFLSAAACEPSNRTTETTRGLESQIEQIVPVVERVTGLKFKEPPVVASRSLDEVRAYLLAKLEDELPPERLEGLVAAYRLFGFIPDTLDYGELLLDIYTEQVAGYFDPDSNVLYVVESADPVLVRNTLAHELIHALQAQHADLRVLFDPEAMPSDQRLALQTVVEGQATLYAISVMMPEQEVDQLVGFWEDVRYAIRNQQEAMPIFSNAPLLIRESLIFPYLAGADFVRWYDKRHPPTRLAFGEHAPTSTEQILHPESYAEQDDPVHLEFEDDPFEERLTLDDQLGSFGIHLLLAELSGLKSMSTGAPLAWGGDRFRVYDGEALVWYSVWDYEGARDRFTERIEPMWTALPIGRPEYAATVEPVWIGERPGLRLVLAPQDWDGWDDIPVVKEEN